MRHHRHDMKNETNGSHFRTLEITGCLRVTDDLSHTYLIFKFKLTKERLKYGADPY